MVGSSLPARRLFLGFHWNLGFLVVLVCSSFDLRSVHAASMCTRCTALGLGCPLQWLCTCVRVWHSPTPAVSSELVLTLFVFAYICFFLSISFTPALCPSAIPLQLFLFFDLDPGPFARPMTWTQLNPLVLSPERRGLGTLPLPRSPKVPDGLLERL